MDELEQRVRALEERVKKLETGTSSPASTDVTDRSLKNRLSINEFLNSKQLGDDVKRTLAIAYWLDSYDGKGSFSSSDLATAFRSAKFKLPININDKINMNVKNGHLAEEKQKKDGKKAWYITNSGTQFVELDLSKIKA